MTCPQDKTDLPEGAARPVPPKKRRGCWVAALVVVAVLAAVVTVLYPWTRNVCVQTRRCICAANLKQIGAGAFMYAKDFQGNFPLELQVLRGYCVVAPRIYLCPSSGKQPEPNPAFVTDYIYIGAGLQEGSTPSDIPIAMDDPRNHDRYINILFKDGRVQGFNLPRKMTSCIEVLHHLFPDLDQSPEGCLVLENAQKADDAGAAR